MNHFVSLLLLNKMLRLRQAKLHRLQPLLVDQKTLKESSSSEIFADLSDNKEDSELAEKAISAVMKKMDDHLCAIGFPFEKDNFKASRYSDGTFPVWYGSMDLITTIYETVHHMIKATMTFKYEKEVTRDRIIYDVFCQGLLIDLTRKKKYYPDLVSEDYRTTQRIGKQLSEQGYPGLLSPSARHHRGINVNIFKQNILSEPRVHSKLQYRLDPNERIVKVFKNNKIWIEIPW